MATNSIRAEHEACSSEKTEEDEASSTAAAGTEEEEDEEEALSLCDLPDNSNNKEEDQAQAARKADSSTTHQANEEEFDFLLWGGPFSEESEMCVADEVFFQGQILPLCKYFTTAESDDASRLLPTGFNNRSESSRSGSMTSEFRTSSSSSRSSSIRSQNSSSTSISSTNPEISKPRTRHQFQTTHPSPKPQPKVSNSRQVSFGHHLNRKSSSSAWDFFRLGVAPAPEIIELQDLKFRCTNNNKNKTCVSRNSSNSSSDDRSNTNNNHHGFRQIWRGCKCSVETVPFDIMITKSTNKTESTRHAGKEKAKQKQKQRRKAISRHRTFEWIKELSHGYNDDEEALLSNSRLGI